jgi:uncharacterized membrane protein HdeD (DUF308 family)
LPRGWRSSSGPNFRKPWTSRSLLGSSWRCQHLFKEYALIILGIILMIAGFFLNMSILWVIGIVLVIAGVVLAVAGSRGRAVGGRRHYY